MAGKFLVSGFSDEIDKMIVPQFTHISKLGVSYFEPRFVDGKNITELSDVEVAILKKLMKEYGIKVSSIGSPIGKISITDEFEPHLKKLERVIDIAKMLDSKYIRIFSFFIPNGENPADYRDEVMNRLWQMVKLAEEKGIILLHENEKNIYGDIAERCLDILKPSSRPRWDVYSTLLTLYSAVRQFIPRRMKCLLLTLHICILRMQRRMVQLCLPDMELADYAI